MEATGEVVSYAVAEQKSKVLPPSSSTYVDPSANGASLESPKAALVEVTARRKRLNVTALYGKGLVGKNPDGTSDPFLVFTLFDDKGKRVPSVKEESTKYINATLDPVWNETFAFSVASTDVMLVECWDRDPFGRNAMGSCRFTVQSLGLRPGESKIETRALKGGDATGEVALAFTLE
jgi:Ca2+-dependent lipid-binding protein